MKTDNNGCSTTLAGQEHYEEFTTRIGRKTFKSVQYDYRNAEGELFSCVASTLEKCREKRDKWQTVK